MILNWNAASETVRCVRWVQSVTKVPLTFYIADNGSSLEDRQILERELSDAILVWNGANLGFAEGQNRGIEKALESDDEFVITMNNDTEIEPATIEKMLAVITADPEIGVVGPRIMQWERRDVGGASGGTFSAWTGKIKHPGSRRVLRNPSGPPADVRFVSGTVMMFRASVLRSIGLLDATFFFGGCEDIDICLRIKEAGFRSVTVPDARVYHKGETRASRWGDLYQFYQVRNVFILMKKHASLAQKIAFAFCVPIWGTAKIAKVIVRAKSARPIIPLMRGLWASL